MTNDILSQGNTSKEQEDEWEKHKLECLVRDICKKTAWGRNLIQKLEDKKGKDYADKIRKMANEQRSRNGQK